MNIGILGCGYISGVYIENTAYLDNINIIGCADLNNNRAVETSVRHGIACYSVTELLSSPSIDLILNLTPPKAHFESCKEIIKAGKHVYVEKPISISTLHAEELLSLADKYNVRIGVAPDTFMADPVRTAQEIIDNGEIGIPLAVNAFMLKSGPEKWHPDPEFFYEQGSGPMYDMGPYYVTTLVQLLGSIRSVSAASNIIQVDRQIETGCKKGTKLTVETPTYISGRMEFASGIIGTLVTSFDVMSTKLPNIEIYGSKGTLVIPDPNTFSGEIIIYMEDTKSWENRMYETTRFNGRGMGLTDMIQAIEENRYHEANGHLGLHVFEVLEGFHQALESKEQYYLKTNIV
ncbi:Gfo/Idh/MocA family protein [Sinobaca sp. H24]|uniref:Gfo/Idh/MocA family protein n=1 Tax=Sinobaca sp. H24 TaxID=2923376 RepID=UPI002079D195|nr:Gfo/Idh/MocA family oxidoreductase [Sinobaca sp. H24]